MFWEERKKNEIRGTERSSSAKQIQCVKDSADQSNKSLAL